MDVSFMLNRVIGRIEAMAASCYSGNPQSQLANQRVDHLSIFNLVEKLTSTASWIENDKYHYSGSLMQHSAMQAARLTSVVHLLLSEMKGCHREAAFCLLFSCKLLRSALQSAIPTPFIQKGFHFCCRWITDVFESLGSYGVNTSLLRLKVSWHVEDHIYSVIKSRLLCHRCIHWMCSSSSLRPSVTVKWSKCKGTSSDVLELLVAIVLHSMSHSYRAGFSTSSNSSRQDVNSQTIEEQKNIQDWDTEPTPAVAATVFHRLAGEHVELSSCWPGTLLMDIPNSRELEYIPITYVGATVTTGLPRAPRAGIDPACGLLVALFDCSLEISTLSPGIALEISRSAPQRQDNGEQQLLLPVEHQVLLSFAESLVRSGVGFVGCQRRVHPYLARQLRRRGITCLSRVSVRFIGALQRLSGARLLASFTPLLSPLTPLSTRTTENRAAGGGAGGGGGGAAAAGKTREGLQGGDGRGGNGQDAHSAGGASLFSPPDENCGVGCLDPSYLGYLHSVSRINIGDSIMVCARGFGAAESPVCISRMNIIDSVHLNLDSSSDPGRAEAKGAFAEFITSRPDLLLKFNFNTSQDMDPSVCQNATAAVASGSAAARFIAGVEARRVTVTSVVVSAPTLQLCAALEEALRDCQQLLQTLRKDPYVLPGNGIWQAGLAHGLLEHYSLANRQNGTALSAAPNGGAGSASAGTDGRAVSPSAHCDVRNAGAGSASAGTDGRAVSPSAHCDVRNAGAGSASAGTDGRAVSPSAHCDVRNAGAGSASAGTDGRAVSPSAQCDARNGRNDIGKDESYRKATVPRTTTRSQRFIQAAIEVFCHQLLQCTAVAETTMSTGSMWPTGISERSTLDAAWPPTITSLAKTSDGGDGDSGDEGAVTEDRIVFRGLNGCMVSALRYGVPTAPLPLTFSTSGAQAMVSELPLPLPLPSPSIQVHLAPSSMPAGALVAKESRDARKDLPSYAQKLGSGAKQPMPIPSMYANAGDDDDSSSSSSSAKQPMPIPSMYANAGDDDDSSSSSSSAKQPMPIPSMYANAGDDDDSSSSSSGDENENDNPKSGVRVAAAVINQEFKYHRQHLPKQSQYNEHPYPHHQRQSRNGHEQLSQCGHEQQPRSQPHVHEHRYVQVLESGGAAVELFGPNLKAVRLAVEMACALLDIDAVVEVVPEERELS